MSTPQSILILYSHGRQPPLNPPPDLKYDLRSIANPPKALRDVSDGRSKRLRSHLLSMPEFTEKLDAVEREISEAMQKKIAEHEIQQMTGTGGVEEDEQAQHEELAEKAEDEDGDGDDDEDDNESPSSESQIVLRVGINCALGHHRSVAFVCELAARPWPKDWLVEIVHRDLEKKRSGGARERQKAVQKGRRRFEDGGGNDY
jgi:RNase adaptor protein for sRNA GlmZ degradation